MKKKFITKQKNKQIGIHNRKTYYSKHAYSGIVIVISALVIALITGIIINRRSISQSVAGTSITKGFYNQAVIQLPHLANATFYNIYFKKTTDAKFTYAVSHIPASTSFYVISYLRKGVTYQYQISAVESSNEFWFSPISSIANIQPM